MFGGSGGGGGGFGGKSLPASGLFGMPAPTDLVSGTLSSSTASGFAVRPSAESSSSPLFGTKSFAAPQPFGLNTDSTSAGADTQSVFGAVSQQQPTGKSSYSLLRTGFYFLSSPQDYLLPEAVPLTQELQAPVYSAQQLRYLETRQLPRPNLCSGRSPPPPARPSPAVDSSRAPLGCPA